MKQAMPPVQSDLLGAEALSPLTGTPLVLLASEDPLPLAGVTVLVDHEGLLPQVAPGAYDAMVTTRPGAPAPWVSVAPARLAAQLAAVQATAAHAPIATAMLARVLRLGEALDFETAVDLESLAYSTLLGGGEFVRWLGRALPQAEGVPVSNPVRYQRDGDAVRLILSSPATHNAMTARMRDGLYEALVNVLEDPTQPCLDVRAEGRCFSVGGSLDEFGTTRDLARAHVVRTQRSSARILHRLGTRAAVHLHGACIGSGIEVAAGAARRFAAGDLIVQLPELRMGLIPGAGGTVTLARAMGRHRLLWLALGAFRIGAQQALDWGLIHAIVP